MLVPKRVVRADGLGQPCVDVEEVNPNFMISALIGTPDTQNFVIDFKRAILFVPDG